MPGSVFGVVCLVLTQHQHMGKEEVKLGRDSAEFCAMSEKASEAKGNSETDSRSESRQAVGSSLFLLTWAVHGCGACALARTALSSPD